MVLKKTHRPLTLRQYKELVKLHKLIIHDHQKVVDDKEWYHLSRKETKAVEKDNWKAHGRLCHRGCGF